MSELTQPACDCKVRRQDGEPKLGTPASAGSARLGLVRDSERRFNVPPRPGGIARIFSIMPGLEVLPDKSGVPFPRTAGFSRQRAEVPLSASRKV
jgi:hypothetical protein